MPTTASRTMVGYSGTFENNTHVAVIRLGAVARRNGGFLLGLSATASLTLCFQLICYSFLLSSSSSPPSDRQHHQQPWCMVMCVRKYLNWQKCFLWLISLVCRAALLWLNCPLGPAPAPHDTDCSFVIHHHDLIVTICALIPTTTTTTIRCESFFMFWGSWCTMMWKLARTQYVSANIIWQFTHHIHISDRHHLTSARIFVVRYDAFWAFWVSAVVYSIT